MIVQQIGYLKFNDLKDLKSFSIYETNKKTNILVINTSQDHIALYYPKHDRLPYKVVEDKRICDGKKIFDSRINNLDEIDFSNWNNKNQIMSYKEFEN